MSWAADDPLVQVTQRLFSQEPTASALRPTHQSGRRAGNPAPGQRRNTRRLSNPHHDVLLGYLHPNEVSASFTRLESTSSATICRPRDGFIRGRGSNADPLGSPKDATSSPRSSLRARASGCSWSTPIWASIRPPSTCCFPRPTRTDGPSSVDCASPSASQFRRDEWLPVLSSADDHRLDQTRRRDLAVHRPGPLSGQHLAQVRGDGRGLLLIHRSVMER